MVQSTIFSNITGVMPLHHARWDLKLKGIDLFLHAGGELG